MDLQNIEVRLAAIEKALTSNKRVLSFEEGCAYTGFSQSYMYKLTSAGIIPFSKPNGKSIFFDKAELDEWLLSKKSKSADQLDRLASTYTSTHKRP